MDHPHRCTPQTPPRKTPSSSSVRGGLTSTMLNVPGSPSSAQQLPSTPTLPHPKRPMARSTYSPLPPASRTSPDLDLSDSLQRSLSFKSAATETTFTERSQTPEPLRIPHSPPVHHRELTPVTRNTRATICYVECDAGAVTVPVTPQEDDEYYNSSRQSLLFGEDLIIPKDLDYLSDDDDDHIVKPPLLAPGLPMANQGPLPPFQLQARKVFSFQALDDEDDDFYNASEDEEEDEDSFTPYAPSGRPAAFDMESVPSDVDIFQSVPDDVSLSRVPSLQRAELLAMTDDAESLDGSFSSLGSSILLPARQRYQDWQQQLQESKTNEDLTPESEELSETSRRQRRRKRRQQAREFLASIEGDESCVAEAASSKILLQRGSPLRRQVSCPQHN